eukprot:Em0017g684a
MNEVQRSLQLLSTRVTKSEADIAHLHVSLENIPSVETDSHTQKNCKSTPRPRTRKIRLEIQSRIREVYQKLASDKEQQLKLDEGAQRDKDTHSKRRLKRSRQQRLWEKRCANLQGEEEVSLWKNVKPSMMSEEESDPEEKTTLRRRRPLWRSEAFNGLIQDVDSRCCDTEISSKRQKKKRVDGEPLPNSAPSNAEPWMYISPINLLKASLVYAFRFEPLHGRELKHDGTNKSISRDKSRMKLVRGNRCLKDYGLRLLQAADSAKVNYAMALLPAFCFSAAFQFELVSQILKHDSTNKSITRGHAELVLGDRCLKNYGV